ncbi:hypothetical protein ACOMHN_021257 [Nucella lapillus]
MPKNVSHLGKAAVDIFPLDTFVSKLCDVIGAYGSDKSCDLCLRRDVTSPAVNWCMDCYETACQSCTRSHLHPDSSPTTAQHVLVSLQEMQRLPVESVLKRSRPVPCGTHPGEDLSRYCLDCRQSACPRCLVACHRKCGNCVTVCDAISAQEEDMAETVLRLQALPPASSATSTSPTGVGPREGVVSGFGDAVEVLEETVRSSRERIRSIAADLKKRIEESEQLLLKELEQTQQMLQGKVEGTRGPAKDHSKTLRTANDRMQFLLKYGSDVEILQTYDTIRNAIRKMDRTGGTRHNGSAGRGGGGREEEEEEKEEDLMFRVNFMPDDAVKLFQRDLKTLGHIQVEDCNSDDGLSSWGVTCTSRDEIIVVDCRNKKMQKFTSNGDLIDHIQISEEPRDVTCCGDDDVAITIMKKQIFVVKVSGSMALKGRIKTQKQYDAISYSASSDAFLVSCLADTSLDVINKQGDVTRGFNADLSGNPIFVQPRYVTFSREGNYVISDVATNTVKCISPEGVMAFSYQPSGAHVLRTPQGLCVDNIGNIFIADYGNSRIQLVTSDGAFQRFVLARESGIQRPVAIHMTSSNKLIVVQSDGMVKDRDGWRTLTTV